MALKLLNRVLKKVGSSYFILIDKSFIDNEMIDINAKYEITLKLQNE